MAAILIILTLLFAITCILFCLKRKSLNRIIIGNVLISQAMCITAALSVLIDKNYIDIIFFYPLLGIIIPAAYWIYFKQEQIDYPQK